jgi:hypothetical protein
MLKNKQKTIIIYLIFIFYICGINKFNIFEKNTNS